MARKTLVGPYVILVGNPTTANGMTFIGLTKGNIELEIAQELATGKSANTGDSVLATVSRSPKAKLMAEVIDFDPDKVSLYITGTKSIVSGSKRALGYGSTNCIVTSQKTLIAVPQRCLVDYPADLADVDELITFPNFSAVTTGSRTLADPKGDDILAAMKVEFTAILAATDQAATPNTIPEAGRVVFEGSLSAFWKGTTVSGGAGLASNPWIGLPTPAALLAAITA